MQSKEEEINRILASPVVDLWKLRELALSKDGLVNGGSTRLSGNGFFSLSYPCP